MSECGAKLIARERRRQIEEEANTPFIWLQDHEEHGVAKCGCRLEANYNGSGPAFFPCLDHTRDNVPTLIDEFKAEHGYWSEYPDYPQEDWKYQVSNGDTILGYWAWLENMLESDSRAASLAKVIRQSKKGMEEGGE